MAERMPLEEQAEFMRRHLKTQKDALRWRVRNKKISKRQAVWQVYCLDQILDTLITLATYDPQKNRFNS